MDDDESDTSKLLKDDSYSDYGTVLDINSHRVSDKWKKKQQKSSKKLKNQFSLLIKFATSRDVALMVFGSLFAILSGALLPILGLFFGSMTNAFISQATYGLIPDELAYTNNNDSSSILKSSFDSTIEMAPKRNDEILHRVQHIVDKWFANNETFPGPTTNNSTVMPITVSQFHSILNQYLIIYLIIGTLMFLFSFLQTVCWELASEHMVFNIRKIYLSQILRQDISWYDQNDEGNLSNKLVDDAERIREGTGYKCGHIIQYLSTFVAGIVVGLVVNYHLTLVILCVAPFLIYLTSVIFKFGASSMIREQEKYAAAGYVAEEALSNIKTVNAFGGQAVEVKKYDYWLEEGRKTATKRYRLQAFIVGLMLFIQYSFYALGFAVGSYLIRIGISSAGSVFTVFFSVVVGSLTVGQSLPYWTMLTGAIGIIGSIRDIVERKVVIDPYSKEGRKTSKIIGNIEFKNTSFYYPSRPEIRVLDGFNLKIESGKQVAIVGSSGAGKSTIVSLILRFYDPTAGEVYIDDVPVEDYNIRWLRQQIGLVSQEPVLFGVSIAENIKYGADDVDRSQVIEAAKKANAHDFILSLPEGYETLVGDTGSQLSGGQKQRIAIARALVRDPKILLLDEATSALDALSEGIVQEALENVMGGRTTIIVAHRLSTVRNADMICVMQKGKLVECGTHVELMNKKSYYFDLVEAQMSRDKTSPSTTEIKGILNNNAKEDEVHDVSLIGSNERTLSDRTAVSSRGIPESSDTRVWQSFHDENIEPEWEVLNRQVSSKVVHDNNSVYAYETRIGRAKETREILTSNEEEQTLTEVMEREMSVYELIKIQLPEWPWLLMGIIGFVGCGLVTPLFALYYGAIFKVFTLAGDSLENATTFWTYMFVLFAIFCGVTYFFQFFGITYSNEKVIARSRSLVFENILRQPVGWFDLDSSAPGVLVTRLARNAPLIKSATGARAGQVLASVITIVAATIIAIVCGWKLALFLIFIVPVIIGLSLKQQKVNNRNIKRDIRLMDNAGRIASETVRNVRTVQALGREVLFTEMYARNLEAPYKEGIKQAFLYSCLYGLTQGLSFYMYAIAFRIGGYLIETGDMTSEDLYRVFFALSLCANSVGVTFSYMQDYNKARQSVRLLNYLLKRQSEIDSSSIFGVEPDISGTIEFKDVHFVYPSRPKVKVLRGLSLFVEAGKTLALVGESGCGKSTVISLLERFYDPESGSILVDGYDIRNINLGHLRSKIGLVTQEPILFNTSIKDNIEYGAVALQESVPLDQIMKAAKLANIHDFIMSLPDRYDTLVGERGVQLSGGQKQRVAIARALIRNPKILLLDEATSALDTESEKIVQAALDEAKIGRTCIVVAHRLSTIQNADVICVVEKGKIVERGTHEELEALKGHYFQLTQRQTL